MWDGRFSTMSFFPWQLSLKYSNSATEMRSDSVAQLVRAWQAICQVAGLSLSLSHCHFSPSFFLVFISHFSLSVTLTRFKVWLSGLEQACYKLSLCAYHFALAAPPPLSHLVWWGLSSPLVSWWKNINISYVMLILMLFTYSQCFTHWEYELCSTLQLLALFLGLSCLQILLACSCKIWRQGRSGSEVSNYGNELLWCHRRHIMITRSLLCVHTLVCTRAQFDLPHVYPSLECPGLTYRYSICTCC